MPASAELHYYEVSYPQSPDFAPSPTLKKNFQKLDVPLKPL
jgi:hypothetical protein